MEEELERIGELERMGGLAGGGQGRHLQKSHLIRNLHEVTEP